MTRPGFISFRITPERRRQIETLAVRMGLNTLDRGFESKVITFALQVALTGSVKWRAHFCDGVQDYVEIQVGDRCEHCGWLAEEH